MNQVTLTPGMFDPGSPDTLFKLRTGQMRSYDLVHNGGWYNKEGKKIGWGDLSPADFNRIRPALGEGEIFVVLGEHDSYWKFVNFQKNRVETEELNPGKKYVVEHARFVITKERVYRVDSLKVDIRVGDQENWSRDGQEPLVITHQSREWLAQLMGV